jgi:hypothetical protein
MYSQRVIPGKNGASARPVKNRRAAKPAPLAPSVNTYKVACSISSQRLSAYFVRAGVQIVAAPQATIVDGRNHLGLALASHKLPGNCPTR